MKTLRTQAMEWWNRLSSLEKTRICDNQTELIGTVRRYETLSGNEIETIWLKQNLN